MPRKIALVNELTDNAAAMAQERCPMCGAVRGTIPEETDYQERSELEIIRRLALFMVDDWKACCVMLLYAALPNAPIREVSDKIRIGQASVCNARQRAAKEFPSLAGTLGLMSGAAIAQQARFSRTEP
jgi:hypothetical protein